MGAMMAQRTFEDKLETHLKVREFPRGIVYRRYRLPDGETASFMVQNMGALIVAEAVDGAEVTKADVDRALRHGKSLNADQTLIYIPKAAGVAKDVEEYAKAAGVGIRRTEL